jgi:hypothetical protein
MNDDRQTCQPAVARYATAKFISVHFRHRPVRNNERRQMTFEQFKRSQAVFGAKHLESFELENESPR